MKVPLLSRCFLTTPPIIDDDEVSATVGSASTMLIGCETGSEVKTLSRNRQLFIRMRRKMTKSNQDHAAAARRALGLESVQSSEQKFHCDESVVTTASVDIDCKGLRHQVSVSRSLPPNKKNSRRTSTERRDNISLPTKSSSRRRSSTDSVSSAMDESCSGHSILDELMMEVYKDPYEEFLLKLNSSVKTEGKIEEVEVDVLTQLPAIKMNTSPKRTLQKRTRRSTIQNSGSSSRVILSLQLNSYQHSVVDPEDRDENCTKHKFFDTNTYLGDQSDTKEIVIGRTNVSSASSVSGKSISNPEDDALIWKMEHHSVCGYEDRPKRTSACNVHRTRRATGSTSSSIGSYHGRVEV